MDKLKGIVATLCGKLPGTSGLAGYVVCCVLPCRWCLGLVNGKKAQDKKTSATTALLSRGTRKVLVLGLDGSGKSSFLWLSNNPTAEQLPKERLPPTTGVQRLTRKELEYEHGLLDLDMSEVGGSLPIRPFWRRYMSKDINVLVFFVDASAPDRFGEAVLQFAVAQGAAAACAPRARFVIVASRVDAPGAVPAKEVHAAIVRGAAGVPIDATSIVTTELALCGPGARASVDDFLEVLASLAS